MIRSLEVFVDQNSWPSTGSPPFPATFSSGSSSHNVSVLPTLLLIGQLTTPPLARGVSLSEFWAWVRYLYAFSSHADLRISKDFAGLDSHQKAILSDDFGMGIPISYLINRLDLVSWSDGRYFMDRMSALVSGPLPVPRKRGPQKAPDFVFMDRAGMLHVVECKGGQSGDAARDRQLSHFTSSGGPSGGVVQKKMVLLPAHLQGQRLACGLSLAVSGKSGTSNLKIVDPEFEIEFDLSNAEPELIRDPLARASLAISLRSAGFGFAAAAVGAPSGTSARTRSSATMPVSMRRSRRRTIEQRNVLARSELASTDVATFMIGGVKLAGRELAMVLPIPLTIGDNVFRRIIVRQGVTLDLVGDVLERGLVEEPLPIFTDGKADLNRIALDGEGAHAELRMGGGYVSEIILEKSAGAATTSKSHPRE